MDAHFRNHHDRASAFSWAGLPVSLPEDPLALALSALQDIEDARRQLSRLLFHLPEPAKTTLWVLVNGPLKDVAPAGLSILAGA